jgi:hypothetical protein
LTLFGNLLIKGLYQKTIIQVAKDMSMEMIEKGLVANLVTYGDCKEGNMLVALNLQD